MHKHSSNSVFRILLFLPGFDASKKGIKQYMKL